MLHREHLLKGVKDPLVQILRLAASRVQFDVLVVEGVRSKETQNAYLAAGKTKTSKSQHLTGDAVDVVPCKVGQRGNAIPLWNDRELMLVLRTEMFRAADELGILLRWGGDWNMNGEWRDEKFVDWVHWELPAPHNQAKAKAASDKRKNGTVP